MIVMRLPALLLVVCCASVSRSAIVSYELDRDVISFCETHEKPCKQWTISLKHDGKEKWRTPLFLLQYSQTFGEWHCDFLIKDMGTDRATDMTSDRKGYISQCLKGNITALDGFFDQADKYFHLRFDVAKGKQQLIVEDHEAPAKPRSLDQEEEEDDMVFLRSMTDQSNPLGWDPPGDAKIRLAQAEIELGVMVDSYLMRFCGNDENEAERLVHQLVNGVNAIFQPVNIRIRIIHFMCIDPVVEDSFGENYTAMLEYLPQLYHWVLVSDLQNTKSDRNRVRGVPDAVFTFTHQRFVSNATAGIAFVNSICKTMAHGLTTLPHIREDFTGLESFLKEVTYPRALLYRKWSPVIAHEIGHILGLRHQKVDAKCGCLTPKGTCIMSYSSKAIGLQWSSCSKTNLTKRLNERSKHYKECLFTEDVFDNNNIIIVPRVAPAVVLERYDNKRDNIVILNITFKYIAPVSLVMKRSINLDLDYEFVFFYRNDEASDRFLAIEFLGQNLTYSGVFHLDDRRVELIPAGKRKYSTRFTQVVKATGTTAAVKTKGVSLDLLITVLIGMDKAFINTTGGTDAAFIHIVRCVNMADAAYRRIGVRIRMTGFHSFDDSNSLVEQAANFYRQQNKTENVFLLFSSSEQVASNHSHHRVCSSDNVALIRHDNDSYRQGAEVAHQIGHLLGLDDESRCLCDSKLGTCVMNASSSTRSMLLSTCSLNDLRRLKDENCIAKMKKRQAPTEIIVLRVVVTMFLVVYGLLILFAICKLMDKAPSATEIQVKLRPRIRRGVYDVTSTKP